MRLLNFKLVFCFWRTILSMKRLVGPFSSWSSIQQIKRSPWLLAIFVACLLTIGYLYSYDVIPVRGQVPRKNIVFLKTHKCASSTIQNVLLRYGDSRNLTLALPTKLNYFGHPKPFNRIFVPYETDKVDFNILAHHSRFNYQEMSLLMPEDTIFITIVRNPADLMESLYQYYLLEDYYQTDLDSLVKNQSLVYRTMITNRYYQRVGFNQMAFDLGLDPSDFFKPKVLHRFCHILDKQFDLVMLAERMDESLILLKDLMRWTLDDVVAFRLNARKSRYKSKLSPEGLRLLKAVSLADEVIYDHFRRKFEERVESFGRNRMARELSLLKEKQVEIFNLCVREAKDSEPQGKESTNNEKQTSYFNEKYLVEYKLKKGAGYQCQRLFASELQFTEQLRKKQAKLLQPYAVQAPPKPIKKKFKG